jgi:hypothetical protein
MWVAPQGSRRTSLRLTAGDMSSWGEFAIVIVVEVGSVESPQWAEKLWKILEEPLKKPLYEWSFYEKFLSAT